MSLFEFVSCMVQDENGEAGVETFGNRVQCVLSIPLVPGQKKRFLKHGLDLYTEWL